MCAQRRLRSAWVSTLSDQSLRCPWRKLGSLATHWAHSEDSDQTGRMPRLILVFAERTVILLILSWGGSFVHHNDFNAYLPMYFRSNHINLYSKLLDSIINAALPNSGCPGRFASSLRARYFVGFIVLWFINTFNRSLPSSLQLPYGVN